MKHLIWALTLSLLSLTAYAQHPLQEAEQLYRQGKFSAALSTYETALKNYPMDAFIYYNIGNCYFKMGSRGLAVANYYRAFKLAPRDHDIRHNLALTLQSSGERFIPTGIPEVLHRMFFYLSQAELTGLVYLLFWITCACLLCALLRRKWNGVYTLVCLITLIGAGWWYARTQQDKTDLAVIAAPVAEVRSGPGTNFPASASVTQGHLLTVLDTKDTWYEVVVSSQGLKGWIEKDAVEKI